MTAVTIKVLLVEDNPGDARLTTEHIESEGRGGFQVVWQPTLAAAVQRLQREPFDIILLDVDLPDSWGLHGLEVLRAKAPAVPVVMLTRLSDDALGAHAIEQGASGFLSKWRNNDESLVVALRDTLLTVREAPQTTATNGEVIGFAGVKGGVGATTLVLNLAAALARNGVSVSAGEMGPWPGSFRHHLRQTPAADWSHLAGLAHTMIDDDVLRRHLVASHFGFDLLFGPQSLDDCRPLPRNHSRVITTRLAGLADVVLFDLGRCSPGTEALTGLCGRLILVVDRDPVSVAMADASLRTLQLAGTSFDTAVVVVDRTPVVRGPSPDEIGAALGCDVIGSLPFAVEALYAAQAEAVPLVVHDPQCRFALAVDDLASSLVPHFRAPTLSVV
jgi:CheY-like chemotaxis protein